MQQQRMGQVLIPYFKSSRVDFLQGLTDSVIQSDLYIISISIKKGTYFHAGTTLAMHVLFIMVVYAGLINVSLILFKERGPRDKIVLFGQSFTINRINTGLQHLLTAFL